ncbi:MAG: hypothetical protein ACETWM_02485 [Candidatus Lokiarchaeia archaeon]
MKNALYWLKLPVRIIFKPRIAMQELKQSESFKTPILYTLILGLITSVLAAILTQYGVSYVDPRNCGGSAQILAGWVIAHYGWVWPPLNKILGFILLNEFGYFILTVAFIPFIAPLARWLTLRSTEDAPRSIRYYGLSCVQAICYGMTPASIFGWIPNPISIIGLWALVWQVYALKIFYNFNWKKAIIVFVVGFLGIALLREIASLPWILGVIN